MEPSLDKAQDVSTGTTATTQTNPIRELTSMGDLGKELFAQAAILNAAAAQHIAIGRQQAFREVKAIVQSGKPYAEVVDALLALCEKERE